MVGNRALATRRAWAEGHGDRMGEGVEDIDGGGTWEGGRVRG